MTNENRETMERAIGIIEGCSFCASQKVENALALATHMLVEVLENEPREGNK